MEVGESDENTIEFVIYIFRHCGNLLDDNQGKDDVENSAENK